MPHRIGLARQSLDRPRLHRPVAIAIPVRDEAERIAACLCALAGQCGAPPPVVALLLNNCTDASEAIVRALAPSLPTRIDVRRVDLPPWRAHAGTARQLAMQRAAALAGPGGVLLTTDADAVVPPDWLANNLAALEAGADAVTGRAVIDPDEARLIPEALHAADARECAYAALLDEIASLLDPDDADPWPRHAEASGASIAVTEAAWRLVGGLAPLPFGEDRGFIDSLRRRDCRIRHAPEVWVSVSGRIEGRAVGGMADTIRRRLLAPDLFLDDQLERVDDAVRRARLRRLARVAFQAGDAPRGPGASPAPGLAASGRLAGAKPFRRGMGGSRGGQRRAGAPPRAGGRAAAPDGAGAAAARPAAAGRLAYRGRRSTSSR